MPYTINKFNNQPLVVLEDGTIDTSTTLGLVGRNYVGYGETQNENFLWLLENFANDAPPSRPLAGQTWFNTTVDAKQLQVYDGTAWHPVGNATVSTTAPDNPSAGQMWVDKDTNKLSVYLNDNWQFIGPENVEGFAGITRAHSATLIDSTLAPRPVIFLTVNGVNIGVISASAFTIDPGHGIIGFSNIVVGLNISTAAVVKGNLTGTASTATALLNARQINGVAFDGTSNITVKASTTRKIIKGAYLTGNDFDGSTEVTLAVDASSANVSGKVVARNASGGFAAGIITADLIGNVTINTGTSTFNIVEANEFIGASLSGNSATTTKLKTARKINGINFDGTADIIVTASAGTLTGTYLNPAITYSQLTEVGTLISLTVADQGISIGNPGDLTIKTQSGPEIISENGNGLKITLDDADSQFAFWSGAQNHSYTGVTRAAFVPLGATVSMDLGSTTKVWGDIYADNLVGNADTATLATTATNIAGGSPGSIPYQTASGETALLPLGSAGYVLKAGSSGNITWDALALERLTAGSYIKYTGTGTPTYYDTQLPLTISVDATNANTASKVVARDSSGNFSAGTITADLTGVASSATKLATARNINGVAFDGTANITVPAVDATKVPLAGGTMTGFLTLSATPTDAYHATTKQYVDTRIPVYTFTYGANYSTTGYTNQVGSFNYGANYFDVFPPSGKAMSDLKAFIPSIHVVHYAGGVDGNDSIMNTYEVLSDRIRVRVQNTEQRSTPAANWLAVWS